VLLYLYCTMFYIGNENVLSNVDVHFVFSHLVVVDGSIGIYQPPQLHGTSLYVLDKGGTDENSKVTF
jgi:hypothetical protein